MAANAASPDPPWAQPGITDVRVARAFVDALRSRDTLVFPSSDGDVGYRLHRRGQRARGHFAGVSPNVVAATPPAADLLAYHRSLGLGPERIFCPAAPSAPARLAQAMRDDVCLLEAVRTDATLKRILVAFKDRAAEQVIERLKFTPVYCTPASTAYEAANDKLRFARAGAAFGFETVPLESVSDAPTLAAVFGVLSETYGDGCIVRLRRGAGGDRVYHARTLAAARRIWRRLRPQGEVLVAPCIPPRLIVRNVAAHGIVTDTGFAPLVFSDQLLRKYHFRGGRVTSAWRPDEIALVVTSLDRIARWLGNLGYMDAPAGIDGFFIERAGALRFLALDPNIRLTGTMLPWATVVALSEAAGRRFVWQFEGFFMLGPALTLPRLQQRLGSDLLSPTAIERGGVLPILLATQRLGPLGGAGLVTLLLAHDPAHLEYLRERVCSLAFIVR